MNFAVISRTYGSSKSTGLARSANQVRELLSLEPELCRMFWLDCDDVCQFHGDSTQQSEDVLQVLIRLSATRTRRNETCHCQPFVHD